MSIQFEYFYGNEAEQFTFYRIPKILVTSPTFKRVSDSAKLLYGLMLDRMGLSIHNGWVDDENRAYIFFTTNDVMEQMCCGTEKATKLLAELDAEKGIGLIERKKQGQGKPAIIYLKKFYISENNDRDLRLSETEIPDFRESKSNYNKYNNTDFNYTEKNNTESSDTEIISYPINRGNENSSPPLPAPKGIDTIRWIEKRQLNPTLKINGILLTMVDGRTNLAKDISQLIRKTYGGNIKVFKTEIPLSVKAAETSAVGKSIYSYNKNGKVADAYRNLTKEVMNNEQRTKHKSEIIR